jgi:hypothetical protein
VPCSHCLDPSRFDPSIRGSGLAIHQVITGGESGNCARPAHPQWFIDIRNHCLDLGVDFFHKQWGAWKPVSEMSEEEVEQMYYPRRRGEMPDSTRLPRYPTTVLRLDGSQGTDYPPGAMLMFKVGKKRAGRLLQGKEWNMSPDTPRATV